MQRREFSFNPLMWVPIGGWLYLVWGLFLPFENTVLLALWWIDVFLSVVVHLLQIPIAIPIGRRHGFSDAYSAFYTFIFGATWWRPLKHLNDDTSRGPL